MANIERRSPVFDFAAPRLFSIDAGRPFLADLAEGLIDALGTDLASAVIFLPTRRAVRAAADAVLDVYESRGTGAALLPRFRAIGDIDDDEMLLFQGAAADELALPPALTATERLAALARMIAARDARDFAGQENWPAAIAAARELGKLLDSLYMEEIDPAAIRALKVGDVAGHWARALTFLSIITVEWPRYLEAIGRSDPAFRRARLIDATARRLASAPPAHAVIIAGTTASAPAVARLVAAIAQAPLGAAVLPGLDRGLDVRGFAEVDDPHPQSGMKALLGALSRKPADVAPWPGSGAENPRARLLTLALRPAEATDDWLALVGETTARDPGLAAATEGLAIIDAVSEEAEATIIAALFRETAETPGRTAILVTPDRNLARRVALKMRRWDIVVDDSAGVPFANSGCGVFLRLVARHLDDPGDPVALNALIRHPLFRADPRAVDALDRAGRGTRPPNGVVSLEEHLRAHDRLTEETAAAIAALKDASAAFPRTPDAPFGAEIDGHLAAAERLAGARRLWSGEDGDKGAQALAALAESAGMFDGAGARRYPDVFDALLAGVTVRPRMDAHPRLSILGPLEARLISADHVILGGLNEGVWPSEAASDPFLSRPMRRALGLPSPERRIGLAAHDFEGLAAQRRVTLTRAQRADGKPQNPSRWLIRLRNIMTGAGALARTDRSARWRTIAAALDRPPIIEPATRPLPAAGPGRRPEALSVTEIETWLRDPYAIYARHLLGLRKLDEPGTPFTGREAGLLLHKVLEEAAVAPAPPTPATLAAIFARRADKAGLMGADRRLWSAAAAGAFEWFARFDAAARAAGARAHVEVEGAWTLAGIDPPFTLRGRADRIDIAADGRAAPVDYKLRRMPTEGELKTFSPQLPLIAAMVEAGAFPAIGAAEVAAYAYHRLVARKADDSENTLARDGADARSVIERAAATLKALVAAFDAPTTMWHSQPRPQFSDEYGAYDQLARRREWRAAEEEEDF